MALNSKDSASRLPFSSWGRSRFYGPVLAVGYHRVRAVLVDVKDRSRRVLFFEVDGIGKDVHGQIVSQL